MDKALASGARDVGSTPAKNTKLDRMGDYMEFKLKPSMKFNNIEELKENKELIEAIKSLNNRFIDETYKCNKVAYLYENMKTGDIVSYNEDVCFYAASSIKMLVCLMLFERASRNELDLNEKVLVTMNDIRPGTGTIINDQKEDTYYTYLELIRLTIVESDNTAYIKLVAIVTKDKVKEYGKQLGALHTLETEKNDSFGITNCTDLLIYWKAVKKFIDENNEYGPIFKDYLLNPSVKFVKDETLGEYKFVRKYGAVIIACHEAGYIEDECFMIILTQLNQMDYKEEFIDSSAKDIIKIHESLKNTNN